MFEEEWTGQVNPIRRKKAKWIEHMVGRNCLLHDSIEENAKLRLIGDLNQKKDIGH